MKTNKILQVALVIIATGLFVSCVGNSSSSQQQQQQQKESFWEGQVQPGTYSGSWTEYNPGGTEYVNGTLTIYDDDLKSVKYKERTKYPSGHEGIEISTGFLEKHVEIYNGERKVWYGIETEPEPGSRYSQSMNLSPTLQFSPGNCSTYQEYSSRIGSYGYLRKQ